MTRFFITLEEAIGLLFNAAVVGKGGDTIVIDMPSCKIQDLAEILMDVYGEVPIQEIGLFPGEKLHEVLVSKIEARNTYKLDKYFVISQQEQKNSVLKDSFSSNTSPMLKEQIKTMLSAGGFI